MDFSLNDEQSQLKDSIDKFVRLSYGDEQRRNSIRQHASCDPAIWQQFSELGWLALPFAEDDGGFGGSLADTMVLMECFGKGLVIEPYIATVVTGGGFLRHATTAQRAQWLAPLLAGQLQVAFAVDEYERVHDLTEVGTRLTSTDAGLHLSGSTCCVANGDQADLLIVLARSAGQAGETEGLSLLLIPADAPGVSILSHRSVDGQRAAEIHFDQVTVSADQVLGSLHEGHALAERVIRETLLALAAEAVGALSVLLYSTVDYAKTRKQFGVPIGSFQALQHRMTNMFMAYEQTQSLLLAATLKVQEGHDDAARAVHALKAQIGIGGRLIAQEAIQMHGGMGMTDELAIGHYFKRVMAIDVSFGSADSHVRAFADG